MDNNKSRYELVHDVFKLAKELEEEDRVPVAEEENQIYKEVNKPKKKRNYVLEAFQQIKEADRDAD